MKDIHVSFVCVCVCLITLIYCLKIYFSNPIFDVSYVHNIASNLLTKELYIYTYVTFYLYLSFFRK